MLSFVPFLAYLCAFFAAASAQTDLRIVRLESCTTSKKSLVIDKCEGAESKFSLGFNIFRPLPKILVQLNLFKIDSAEFKPVFKSKPIEWCAIAEGRTKANPIVKTFISSKVSKLPEVLRKCPLNGSLALSNVPVSGRTFAILPPASYRLQGKAYDGVDKEIFYFSVLFRIEENKRS